ncbi:hypothetical protein BJ508DRAFT_332814 [Ascobolus immersus RN42]|uniref:Uncharacterized protein n=1 Tax=Ascobolus immersus RN42 TaxID=1160509 RepID=A0A3N4HQ91_ASCIM|nr:hypothetical protein BJ508DRAFT_332814 [Ascobolus immersus RN42]
MSSTPPTAMNKSDLPLASEKDQSTTSPSSSEPLSPIFPTNPPNTPSTPGGQAASATRSLLSLGIKPYDSMASLGFGSAPDRFVPARLRPAGNMNPFVAGGGYRKRPGVSRSSTGGSYSGRNVDKVDPRNLEGNAKGVEGDLWEYGL